MMEDLELKQLCDRVYEVVKTTGRFILGERKTFASTSIEYKGLNDLVSYVDKEAEKMLVQELQRILPGSGFITEENTISIKDKPFTWIIDPLDGTTNFVHGVPCFCVSVALARDNEPILGVIYEMNHDECFYAWKGGGAYLDGKAISVSDVLKLKDSLIVTGFAVSEFSHLKATLAVFEYCIHKTHGIRRLGSAAADIAYVACGRFEGFFESGLSPWDIAAGIIIVKEAGGTVSDFSGGNNFLFGREIIATNKNIFNEFQNVVKDNFKTPALS
jgi:myo-inositol-1(or 4)-monophosphatase